MKKSFFLSLVFLFFTLYYFFFPLTSGKEYIWIPSFVQDLSKADGQVFPLMNEPEVIHNGTYSGILKPDGGSIIRRRASVVPEYSFSHTFVQEGENRSVLINRLNHMGAVFQLPGTPMVLGDHYLICDSAEAMLQEVGTSGDVIWSWEGVSPVTALAVSDLLVAFGTLDGSVYLFRKDGNSRIIEPLPGSHDAVIYGLSLSDNGNLLSLVAGGKNQYLILYKRDTSFYYQESGRYLLKSHYIRPVKTIVNSIGDAVWVEQPGEICRYTQDGESLVLPLEGPLLKVLPDEVCRMVYSAESIAPALSLIKGRSVSGELHFTEGVEGVLTAFSAEEKRMSLILDDRFLYLRKEAF